MNRMIVYLVGTLLLAINAGVSAMEPVAVSPGSDSAAAVVGQACPTFSWSRMDGATSYEVAVFDAVAEGYVPTYGDMAALAPVISVEIEAPALSWTPSSGQCLGTGLGYVWYVKGTDAAGVETWSAGKGFTVDLAVSGPIQEAVEGTVNEYLTNEWSGTESYLKVKEVIKAEVIKETGVPGQGSISILGNEGDAQNNTYYGTGAGASLDGTGFDNAFFGVNAGNQTTGGALNTFIGRGAGFWNTTGSHNTFLGYAAGNSNGTGGSNTFLGRDTGYSNTTGSNNLFLGFQAGFFETGSNRLYIDSSSTTAPLIYGEFDNDIVRINGSLGIGKSPATALDVSGTVTATAFSGDGSGLSGVVTAEVDPEVGTLTSGKWCTSDGSQVNCATNAPLTSEADPEVGTLTSGKWCTSDGSQVNCATNAPLTSEADPEVGTLTSGKWCTSDGSQVNCATNAPLMGNEGDTQNNTYYGTGAGASLDGTGTNNAFFGVNAGNQTTGGDYNTFIGRGAGYWNTTGGSNTFLGYAAGNANTSGSSNTFIGWNAGYSNTTGNNNTFLGRTVGNSNTTGADNTFIGKSAGYWNTTGTDNTFLGYAAGNANTSGGFNTFIGWNAGYWNTTGSNNLFLGYQAGLSETGSNRLYIDSSSTTAPLIYGEFDNDIVRINGSLGIGKSPATALDVSGTVTATAFSGDGSGLSGVVTAEVDPEVGTLTSGKWCTSDGSQVNCATNAPLTSEADPEVGTLTSGKWCTSDGSQVNCATNAPLTSEADPEVGTLTSGKWCTSDGSQVNCATNAPLTSEADPEVGTLTSGKWCTSDGSQVNCATNAPLTSEADPQVGSITTSYVPRWDGSSLVSGIIYDDGNFAKINGNLEVTRSDGAAKILVEETNASVAPRTLFELKNAGNTKFAIDNTNAGVKWAFTNSGWDFRISRQGSGVVEMALDNSGNMTIQGTLTQLSSRAAKHDIHGVDATAVLSKVLALPIARWRYLDDTQGARHLGPMAEDFAAAFGLGATNKGISTLDTSGVALAAIQGLKVEKDEEVRNLKEANTSLKREKDAEIAALRKTNNVNELALKRLKNESAALAQRLEQLEKLLLSKKVALR